jgi:AcrR family transcriptional regulator
MKDTRQFIIDTSLQLFLEKTFKEVTLREIVEKTGLSKGAFYHYFSKKEDILNEALQQYISMRMNFDWNAYDSSSLFLFVNAHVTFLEKLVKEDEQLLSRNFFSLMFDGIRMFPEFREIMQSVQEGEHNAWVKVIRQARKSGEIHTSIDDDEIADMFIYMSDGLSLSNLLYTGKDPLFTNRLRNAWNNLLSTLK